PSTRDGFQAAGIKNLADKLAELAPTPLAYLDWFKVLCEQGALDTQRREKGIERYVRAEYASTPFAVIQSVARAFPSPEHELDREALKNACGGSDADLA